jgi:hypothetical protein
MKRDLIGVFPYAQDHGSNVTKNTRVPVCPYCWQPDSAIGLSSDTEIVCKNCEKEYLVKRIVKITFSTFKKESGNA